MGEETAAEPAETVASEPAPEPAERDLHATETVVVGEKNALDGRIIDLNLHIDNVAFRTLPQVDQERLIRQRLYMVCYSNVLLERVQGFNHVGALRMLSFPAVWVIKD